MTAPKRHFIHRLRSSPHHVKRRWFWGLTLIAMILVFGIWLVNLETFMKLPPPATDASVYNATSN